VIPTIGFFNCQGGVGTTSLLYNLAWMYADLGRRVLAVDLDPQAGLTSTMIDEERLEVLWSPGGTDTIYGAIRPRIDGVVDIARPHREPIGANLELVVGDLAIATLDDELASQWERCLDRTERAFRATTAFHLCIQRAAQDATADVVLVDLGPTLGAINRAALVACHHVVVPVTPGLFALQGLRTLGPVVRRWRDEWGERVSRTPRAELAPPANAMGLAGYVVIQGSVQLNRPARSPERWLLQRDGTVAASQPIVPTMATTPSGRDWMSVIPDVYATAASESNPAAHPGSDPRCLGILKPHSGLSALALDARKPIFHLRPADGALGAYARAARLARKEFEEVAERLAAATWQGRDQSEPRSPR
jgi:cellulose biosynthesis protein BcsQ